MLLNNYAIRNAGQSRALGGNLDPTYNFNLAKMMTFYVGVNNVVDVTNKTSQPGQGYRPPYSLVLAPKAGGMSLFNSGTGSMTAAQVAGLFGSASMAGVGTISNAASGLIVEMLATIAGLGGLTASVIGQLQAAASLAGTGSLTAAQSALAGMVSALTGTGLLSDAQQQALGQMTADIYVNQSEATVNQIVFAVWNALAASYNESGTMGNKLNGAGSAGDPWTTDLSSYNTSGTAGKKLKDLKNPSLLIDGEIIV